MAEEQSQKFSLTGWNVKDWFKGNLTTIVEIVKVGGPLFLGSLATSNPALLALITAAGKLLLDTIHYWLKD